MPTLQRSRMNTTRRALRLRRSTSHVSSAITHVRGNTRAPSLLCSWDGNQQPSEQAGTRSSSPSYLQIQIHTYPVHQQTIAHQRRACLSIPCHARDTLGICTGIGTKAGNPKVGAAGHGERAAERRGEARHGLGGGRRGPRPGASRSMHPERRRQGCDGLDAVADGISSRARQGASSTAGFGAAVARVRVPGFPEFGVSVRG